MVRELGRLSCVGPRTNKALQADKVAVSHLLQAAQKLRHNNFATEQRHYVAYKVGTKEKV